MNIDEIRRKRHELEEKLKALIITFEEETHVAITRIELQHGRTMGVRLPVLYDLRVEVNLDA